MKYLPIQEIEPIEKDYSWLTSVWRMLLFCLLGGGTWLALNSIWGEQAPAPVFPALVAVIGFASGMAGGMWKQKYAPARFLWILPWLLLFFYTGFLSPWAGMQAWINQILARWNLIHEGGLSLFAVNASAQDALAFSLIVMLLAGQWIWHFVAERKIRLCSLCCLFWMIIPLIAGTFSSYSGALLLSGLLGAYLPGRNIFITFRSTAWMLAAVAGMMLLAIWLPADNMKFVDQFRESTADTIHEFRYGEELLPKGELRKADQLQQKPGEELLQVETGQVKSLYLKGFVGSRYKNGCWVSLPDSAYGGDHAGMLEWLSERGFDPLMQPSEYFALCEDQTDLEKNWVSVENVGASRAALYVPGSLSNVLDGSFYEEKDEALSGSGLRGTSSYMMEEVSGSKPAELTVAEDWIMNPVTEEQQNYSEAESVYREFVYENYLQISETIANQMQKIFWEDETADTNSIYQALVQIRKVLEQRVSYAAKPGTVPEEEDPVHWFLSGSGEGNAMFYASTAVLALRAKGIPSRYVEGYYLPASQIRENGQVSITGMNAHAWVEVYFDGVGWLPVDVTPGYYYDVISLRQMIELPDRVKKTAALEEDSSQAKPVLDMDSSGDTVEAPVMQFIGRTAEIFFGLVGILLLLAALLVFFMEIWRILLIRKAERTYQNASENGQILQIESILYRMLAFYGVDAALGWKTQETDEILARKRKAIEAGEYTRICRLLEKNIYGGIALEPYERRTLDLFVDTIWNPEESLSWKERMKRRYFVLWMRLYAGRKQKPKMAKYKAPKKMAAKKVERKA